MSKQLDIPNEHLLKMLVDENKQPDMFKAILAQDINICIGRVNTELQLKTDCSDSDIEFYRSMLRLIRRVSESEGLKFVKDLGSAKSDNPGLH